MQTLIDSMYDRLRAIGVSVETADAVGPVLDGLPYVKREAVFLWVSGYTQKEIGIRLHKPRETVRYYLHTIWPKCL